MLFLLIFVFLVILFSVSLSFSCTLFAAVLIYGE